MNKHRSDSGTDPDYNLCSTPPGAATEVAASTAAFFAHPALAALIQSTEEIELPVTTPLFAADEPCFNLPYVSAGRAEVRVRDEHGRHAVLYRLRYGELCVVSLAALIRGSAYGAEAVVTERLRVRLLPGAPLQQLLAQSPDMFRRFLACTTARIDGAIGGIRQMIIAPEDVRLARLLKNLFDAGARQSLTITAEEIAGKLGASVDATRQILKKLEYANCIRLSGSEVLLHDAGSLNELIDTGSALS